MLLKCHSQSSLTVYLFLLSGHPLALQSVYCCHDVLPVAQSTAQWVWHGVRGEVRLECDVILEGDDALLLLRTDAQWR